MSDDKSKVSDKASEIAKNIWLAGVGAYGKAVEDAQGRLEKAMEPPKLFRDLVKAGTALEEDAREVLQSTSTARHSVEERIGRVRENFHLQRPARIEDLTVLHKKVDQLTRKVDQLTKALIDQGAIKTPRKKKPATKKPTAKKTAAGKKSATSSKTTTKKRKA
jgi:polyhydroxyalkanoate synthesis regulator phasin